MSKLVPSTLHSLHVVVPTGSQRKASCADASASLSGILSKAPSLRYLRVSASDGLEGRWVDSVAHLPSLETLDILECGSKDASPYHCLPPLSALRHLQHLKLRLPENVPTVGADAFPSLRTLTLDATHAPFRALTALLSTITSQQLDSLTLLNCQCISISINSELHEMAEALRARFSTRLHRLVLDLHGASHPLADTQPLVKSIEPLLEMHDLSDVRITISAEVRAIAASSEDLRKMAEAWPNATRLHLRYAGTAFPLRDFDTVARRCPYLADLVVPGIDASVSELEGLGRAESFGHGLRFLSLYDGGSRSTICDPRRVAQCLDALFPAVDWRCPRDGTDESWEETIEELVQLRIARLLSTNGSSQIALSPY
ncbi:hypothetical protein FKP32DRAFT_1591457 [Trametes sanguinea]|nr:hypothetical protein FKP32DRAFT_1591457 [Trametes sanguinea]